MQLYLQMTKGNVGSLLVFDPAKITLDQPMKEAAGDAVVGIVTERGEGVGPGAVGFDISKQNMR